MRLSIAIALLLVPAALSAATRVSVTVIEQKTGNPVEGLKAGDFTVFDGKTPCPVESAGFLKDPLDIMLLLDTSLAGPMVQPLAGDFIAQLQPKEQMAVVAYHSSADLIQDFTSGRELLLRSISRVRYGNEPRVLDALYAAIGDGFQTGTFRRVVLLLTSGIEGSSRTPERDVLRLARRHQVSIFPVYATGRERGLFETLARQTGGASFNMRDLKKSGGGKPGPRVFQVLRSHYVLTVTSGNLGLGERLRVEVKRPEKLLVSGLPLE